MDDQTDSQLLRAYVETGSEAAFSELVRRHLDFVYSAARRLIGDAHLAEDVTQGVFVALAKSARQLLPRSVLSGWLHRTAHNIAVQTIRAIERRRAREREAAVLSQLLAPHPDPAWQELAPHLDAALGELSEPDRDALFLRFFERKSAREMGATLGISDEAAQKRVNRAVERLRDSISKRGLAVGASALVALLSTNAVQAAPTGLLVAVASAALPAATTLADKTVAMTTLHKTLAAATVIFLAGVGIYEACQISKLREQNLALQLQQAPLAEQIQQLRLERDEAANRLAASRRENQQLARNANEALRLRAQLTALQGRNRELTELAQFRSGSTNSDLVSVDESAYAIPDAWADAGLAEPTAALRTYLWAMAHQDLAKLKEVLSLPVPNKEQEDAFWEWLRQEGFGSTLKGAHIVQSNRLGPDEADECLFLVKTMEESTATTDDGDAVRLKSIDDTPLAVLVRRIGEVWRVVPPLNVVLSPEQQAEAHAAAVAAENSGAEP